MSWKVCPGSGGTQMLSWDPDPKEHYPGAVICLGCSGGIVVVKGSVHPATSQLGQEGLAGKVRKHYVNRKTDSISMRKPKEEA